MAKKMSKSLDPKMLENLDILLNMEILEEEENWQVIEDMDEDSESIFENLDALSEDEDEA